MMSLDMNKPILSNPAGTAGLVAITLILSDPNDKIVLFKRPPFRKTAKPNKPFLSIDELRAKEKRTFAQNRRKKFQKNRRDRRKKNRALKWH